MPFSRIARVASITLLLAAGFLAGGTKVAMAQTLTVGTGTCPPCHDPYTCCTQLLWTPYGAAPNVDWQDDLEFDLLGPTNEDYSICFDTDCYTGQSNGLVTFRHTAGTNKFFLHLAADYIYYPVPFCICGDPTCMADHGVFYIYWHQTNHQGGYLELNNCSGSTPTSPCLPCNFTRWWPDGTICTTIGTMSSCTTCDIRFDFATPLPPCVDLGNISGYPGWQMHLIADPITGDITSISFHDTDGTCLGACASFCFTVPDSVVVHRADQPDTDTDCVSFTSEDWIEAITTSGCGPQNDTCSESAGLLKKSDGGATPQGTVDGGSQNYPNPLDAASGFKTAIPFTTTAKGVASMRVVDMNGKLILRDFENVYGAGQHLFYFSAKDLPAGTYYYTIEFPQGVILVNKTMFVVK